MARPADLSRLRWPLPEQPALADDLLARWGQPHRRYHDVRHLADCVTAAAGLGAGPVELLALWFHDAVHTNTPGADEAASAELALHLLAPLPHVDEAEVARLVRLTRQHRPGTTDRAGAIVCDADLWVLGAEPQRYAESVADLRAELVLDPAEWTAWRRERLAVRLNEPIYATAAGRCREPRARHNLSTELAALGR